MIEPRIDVVTTVVGSQSDPLQPPIYVTPTVRYFCFSDHPAASIPAPWCYRPIVQPPGNLTPIDIARWVKILVHDQVPLADIIVWQDAAYRLAVNPAMFLPLLMRADLLILGHPARATIEQEAEELIRLKLTGNQVRLQAQRYRTQGFPTSWPLSSTGLLVRRNDAHVRRFAHVWYTHLRTYNHPRDQMSFDHCAWATGMQVHRLEGSYRSNPYADWTYTRTRPRRS